MQMYKGLDTITNKHPINERYGVPHHIMNHVDLSEEYFVHRFEKEALARIKDIHSRGKLPIVVGGTHYYLQSILFRNKTIPTVGGLSVEEESILNGPKERVFQLLKENDPTVAEKFHPNDDRRIRRALEIFFKTKRKTSEFYTDQKTQQLTESSLRFRTLVFWVWCQQAILDTRLDQRVDSMLSSNALAEIKQLYSYYKSLSPPPDCERGVWQVIGFKEFLPWLTDGSGSFEDGTDDMKLNTRKYARRQVKWIRKSLAGELNKEKSHNFPNGGKMYVLDSSDLPQWNKNVNKRGLDIAEAFLEGKESPWQQVPDSCEQPDLLPTDGGEAKEKNWKHYKCDVCKDHDGTPLLFVGEQYFIHLKSRKHSSTLNKGKRKREYEEWMKRKSSEKAQGSPAHPGVHLMEKQ